MNVLEALRDIRDSGPTKRHTGICDNLEQCLRKTDQYQAYSLSVTIRKYYISWKHFSGCEIFPVPDPTDISAPGSIYISSSSRELWDSSYSDYAKLRWDLLDHLIKCMEEE